MPIVTLFYAAFGYLALLGAILWGMLFVAHDVVLPSMDARESAAPLQAACVDVGLLVLLALLHRSRVGLLCVVQRALPNRLERSTQAWAAAVALAVIYEGWRALPQVLWSATGAMQWMLSALFYVAWTLILISAFLVSHLDLFEITQPARGVPFAPMLHWPLYYGILIAVWATSVMTVGHLLLAACVTAYLLFDALWAAREIGATREVRRTLSLRGERAAR